MTALAWVVCVGFGALVGTSSGLLGIGGGALLVPFLYALLGEGGWSGLAIGPEREVVVAHATSLIVTLPTAVSGLVAYRGTGLAHVGVAVRMGLGAALGAVAGARVAPLLDPALLQGLFGALLLLAALRMLRKGEPEPGDGPDGLDRWAVLFPFGIGIGFFAALLGVGGGIFAIPVLVHFTRLGLERVAATSLGIVVFASGSGSFAYLTGAELPIGPGETATVGFVLLPVALALLPGAVVGAWVGARLNRQLQGDRLRYLFAALFLILGLRYLFQNAGRLLG